MVNFVNVQVFDWLSRNLMNYLCIDECGGIVNN